MSNTDPRWLAEARRNIGIKRNRTGVSNPAILQFWKDIKRGGIKDEMVPWCAAFTGAMLERIGITSTRFESAKSYMEWGQKLDKPHYGCIAVLTRDGGGHVGFVVGVQANGDLILLGGNQGSAVSISSFPVSRVTGYRWPLNEPLDTRALPVGVAAASVTEA